MRTRTTWLVAGGAAAFVLTPLVAVSASTALDHDVRPSGVVLDAEAANRARAERQPDVAPTASPSPSGVPKATKAARPNADPDGKKTVSAESPISPHSSRSPVSPKTP